MVTPTEHQEAVALMRWCQVHTNHWPELGLIYHIPNGGHRNPIVAAKMKAEGTKPGVCDYFLPVARHGYHGLYLELKRKGQKPSKSQDEFMADVTEQGYRAEWACGWEAAAGVIEWYMGEKREAA